MTYMNIEQTEVKVDDNTSEICTCSAVSYDERCDDYK